MAIETIKMKEQELLQAMLESNVKKLENLISDELIFTDHTGRTINKEEDLDAHKTGLLSIQSLEPSEQTIKTFQDTGIVSVLVSIKGHYLSQSFQGKIRYTRVWVKFSETWKIVAGHATKVE